MPYRFLRAETLRRYLSAAIPSSCALCGIDDHDVLCAVCTTRFFNQQTFRCRQCGIAVSLTVDVTQCGHCLRTTPAFDATIVAGDYVAPMDQLILALKFGHRLAIAPLLARLLRDALLRQPDIPLPDMLVAVPLGPQRLAERGFNQSLEIARPLAKATGIPLQHALLTRTRDTLMQAKLTSSSRHRNMRHAFTLHANAAAIIKGHHIGVLDDVMTTGETLNEIAMLLKRNGASRITNLTVARTPQT